MNSTYKCPACQKPLNIVPAQDTKTVVMYCKHGDCPSCASNDGGTGETEFAAYTDLVSKVADERKDMEQ